MNYASLSAALLVASVASVALADEPANARKDKKEESQKLDGTWKPVTAELAGKPYPEKILKVMTLVLADGKYTVTVGEGKDEGTVKLEPGDTPCAMDIEGTKGPNQGKTIPAIYELKEDTLRICYDLSGKTRPKSFETKPDTQLFLVEYKREKPAAP